MITFQDLISAAEAKGLRFEAYTTFFNRFGDEIPAETIVSINTGDHIWSSWTVYDATTFNGDDYSKLLFSDDNFVSFTGRYNQANGVTQNTWRKENDALKKLGIK
jgi:hypothetical protein